MHFTYIPCLFLCFALECKSLSVGEFDQPNIKTEARLAEFFSKEEIIVEKRTKNGPKQENIIPLIRNLQICPVDDHILEIHTRVCCQNPALNPMQITAAIELYQPVQKPNFVKCRRVEVYDSNESVFR